jgi:hypothetical protein
MIYDCFTFFNELELLELRLHELANVVDKFVLIEATQTHTNKPKPLHYQENHARFSAFHDKIIHIVVDDLPQSSNAWIPENFQRNCIARGLKDCQPDDFILVSDLDEIPRAGTVEKMSQKIPFNQNFFANAGHTTLNSRPFKKIFHSRGLRRRLRNNHPFVWKFRQLMHRYYLNARPTPQTYSYGTRIMRFRDFSCAEEMRHSGYKVVEDGGWHFSWMGGVQRIQEKLAAYAHQERNRPELAATGHIKQSLNDGRMFFKPEQRLEVVSLDDSFPRYLLEHPEKFSNWIKPV